MRIKLPRDSANSDKLHEFLMSSGPLDASKLHEARLKIDIIYDGFCDPSLDVVLESEGTDE